MKEFGNRHKALAARRQPRSPAVLAVAFLATMIGVSSSGCQPAQNSSSWTLSTDDTSLTVVLEGGQPFVKALGSKQDNDNWLREPLKEKLMDTVELHGTVVKTDWKFQGASLDAKKEQLTLRFANADPHLTLNSIWRARPGPGPVEHWLTIVNDSGQPVTVTHQDSLVLDGLTLAMLQSADVWWIKRGGSNASTQGGTFVMAANAGLDHVLKSDPVDAASPVPWLAVQVGTLRGMYVGWEFSGIGRIHVKTLSTNPTRLSVRVGNMPEFKTDIRAGETFLVPPAFVGCYRGDIDAGSHSLHQFILDKLLPPLPKNKPYPSLVFNLYLDNTPTHENPTQRAKKVTAPYLMRDAALADELGFETFMIDAVWFPQSGDWRFDPARFPNGDRAVREYLSQHNMNLGLWMAYTHGSDSDDPGAMNIFRHPDWFTKTYARGQWKSTYLNFWQSHIDLGYEPAREWVTKETQRVVGEYQLDYFKHDYTPIVTQCEQTDHRHKYGTDVSYWSALGYYQVQEALKRRFPNLVLEGCSGGGHIKDFGYIKRVHYITTTDTLSSLPDRQSIWDSTYAFPPAVLMAYTWENMYNRDADRPLPYFWRSAMMSAWQVIPGGTASWTDSERAGLRRAVEIYKSWVRPTLRDAEVHHILPRPDGVHWDGMFYWSPSLLRGTLYIFRPNSDETSEQIRLKGLIADQNYHIRSEDGSVSEEVRTGADLMNAGLAIKLPGKYSSDLVYVEERKAR